MDGATYTTQPLERKALIRASFPSALARGELTLAYQPQYTLQDNKLIGGEALLRWEHDVLGGVSPAEFIPIAEELGLICEVGTWVRQNATRCIAQLPSFIEDFRIAVNVSPAEFHAARSTPELWLDSIGNADVSGRRVGLEITENALMNDDRIVADHVTRLREAGVEISIDDFGSGFSSLSYVKNFDIDCLKLDKSFVMDMPDDPRSVAVVRAIINLAHALGISVVAEGIETSEQMILLTALGCDTGQGFFLGMPQSEEAFLALIRSVSRPTRNLCFGVA